MHKLAISPQALARRLWLRRALGAGGALTLAGCDKLGSNESFTQVLASGETLNRWARDAVGSAGVTMAQEFSKADLSPSFRGNGNTNPTSAEYKALAAGGFADWRLEIEGLVETPKALSLAELKALPSRTQITRHDCVEGWSAIGQWTGVPLAQLIALVKPKAEARYVVFHCADSFGDAPYYESIDMQDARHPQTILAYALNDQSLPVTNGAPLRLRVERQLGYKHAKYLMGLEFVDSLAEFGDGKGGYWEDQGYQWYAGI